MKDKIFNHPLTKIASTPRGCGEDEYMVVFIQHTISRLRKIQADWVDSDFCEPSYFASLSHSLHWLIDYYQGTTYSEEDYSIYSYYAWVYLQKFDEDLERDM